MYVVEQPCEELGRAAAAVERVGLGVPLLHPRLQLGQPGDQRDQPLVGPALAARRDWISVASASACWAWSQPAQPSTGVGSASRPAPG